MAEARRTTMKQFLHLLHDLLWILKALLLQALIFLKLFYGIKV